MHNPQSLSEMRALLASHGLEPNKTLGQHFLADPNIVMKIVGTAGVGPGDQVLEVGPGTGTLTAALASTGAKVVAYELDRSLAPVLEATLSGFPNVEVRFQDATLLEGGELPDTGAWTMVANLPYNVGTPLVLSLLRSAPMIKRFVVMLQKEVADRFMADPGSKTYGLPSVIVGLHAEVTDSFFVPPQVFFPPPNVGSAVIVLDRVTASPSSERAIEIAATAFKKRRKMLRGSLRAMFRDVLKAFEAAGISPTARPEELSADDFVRLAEAESRRVRGEAHPKVNLSLEVFPVDATGMHPLRSVVQALEVCETLSVEAADADSLTLVSDRGRGLMPLDETNLVLKAIAALRASGAAVPHLKFSLDKTLPIAAGMGAGSADAAVALLLAAELCEATDEQVKVAAEATGADVPAVMTGGTLLMEGFGEKLTPLDFAGGYSLLVTVPDLLVPTAEVYRRWDEMGGPRGEERPLEDLPQSLRQYGPFRNDLEPAALDLHPELATYRARVEVEFGRTFFFSGSGPTMFAFLDADEEVQVSPTMAEQLGLRSLFITNPYQNGASVTDR